MRRVGVIQYMMQCYDLDPINNDPIYLVPIQKDSDSAYLYLYYYFNFYDYVQKSESTQHVRT